MARFELDGEINAGDASRFAEFAAKAPDALDLYINSPGGDAAEGAALMAIVERHGSVTARVQGIAASAATLPMVAARQVIIHQSAMVMIHEPSAWGGGTADELRRTAATLDKMSETYGQAYARHTGQPLARVLAWMKAETWLTAEEAVELNFADELEKDGQSNAVAAFDYSKFRKPPERLLTLAKQYGWATGSLAGKQ